MAVITLPDELFYPAALKQVIGVVIKKGVPHPIEQNVFWARAVNDGYLKLKSKRLPGSEMRPPRETPNDIPQILPKLQSFVNNPSTVNVNIPLICKTCPIAFSDPLLELLPEVYIDSKPISAKDIERAADDLARETASLLIRFRKETLVKVINAQD